LIITTYIHEFGTNNNKNLTH